MNLKVILYSITVNTSYISVLRCTIPYGEQKCLKSVPTLWNDPYNLECVDIPYIRSTVKIIDMLLGNHELQLGKGNI